jgi:hypothetical protein
VSFRKNIRRAFQPGNSRFVMRRVPPPAIWRVIVLAALGIGASAWALVEHYTREPRPMLVPLPPRPAGTYDPDAGEVPVPDFVEGDGG